MKRDPVFTETMQIGIVVRDLDATIRHYEDDFGIGPWQLFEFTPEDVRDLREHGQPVGRAWRVRAAVAMVGQVMWELIEPLDEESVVGRFLAEKGVGVHHIAVATPNYDDVIATRVERGEEVVLSGELSGIRVAYLATDRDLGVITEVFDGFRNDVAAPGEQPARAPLSGVVRHLVEGANQAHLATVLPDGAPHSVPLWIGLEGDDVAFLTDPGSRKARNIEHDQRVALSVTDRNQPFTMAQIRGRVIRRLEGDEAWTIIDRISQKYVGAPYPRALERVVFLVRPEHVHGMAYA